MRVEILTIFPEIFSGFLTSSLIGKAIERSLFEIRITDIRKFADPPHYKVDDTPYGGGAGMVMLPEPIFRAISDAKTRLPKAKVICLSAGGRKFDQLYAEETSKCEELILVCGRYEGIDQRVIDLMVDEEVSIGDYVLMGGEIPAMVILEASLRLKENVIGNKDSLTVESFSDGARKIEAPQFTRPEDFRGNKVPDVLLSGDHKKIREWRAIESDRRTNARK